MEKDGLERYVSLVRLGGIGEVAERESDLFKISVVFILFKMVF